MTIYVDKFEVVARKRASKRSEKKLEQLLNASQEVRDLGADYIVVGTSRGYVIERKTVSDLISSVFHSKSKASGRLYDQLKRILVLSDELSEKHGVPFMPLLIVEGSLFSYNKKAKNMGRKPVSLKVFRGILLSTMEMGVCVFQTSSFGETVDLILHLEERSGKEKKISGFNIHKSLRDIREEAMHMIYAVSGIGEKKARALIEKYGSVRTVVNLDRETLKKELGPKIGGHFYDVVNSDVSTQKRITEAQTPQKDQR